jgi:hypothetical protein
MGGIQRNESRKQRFEDIQNDSVNAQPDRSSTMFVGEDRIYRTVDTAGWLLPFTQGSPVSDGDPADISKEYTLPDITFTHMI